MHRDRAPAPGRNSESQLWTARCGPLRCRWHASGGEGFYTTRQGKRDCPLPLQPHPQNQPDPLGEGTTLKPDISLATKSGHFNLLRTDKRAFAVFEGWGFAFVTIVSQSSGSESRASITQPSEGNLHILPQRMRKDAAPPGAVADLNCRCEPRTPVHPLLEGVGALTIPRDGPVGIPLAL